MVMHMYAYDLGRTVADVPEVEETFTVSRKGTKIYRAACHASYCRWRDADTDKEDFDKSVEAHIKWHEEGMQE